ncbi:MAG: FHA domain-containing protein, partial [Pyrinomonadaceae bacterium]|nr:FHA domain-containing protein [Pyrinomonadaceae bacterium]
MAIKLIVKKQEEFGDTSVKELILEEQLISGGCDFNSTIFLDDPQIADEQFVVIIEDEKTILVNRAEGTFFNDEPLPREVRCEINNGDEIQIGLYTISFLNVNYKAKKSIFIPATSGATVKVIET